MSLPSSPTSPTSGASPRVGFGLISEASSNHLPGLIAGGFHALLPMPKGADVGVAGGNSSPITATARKPPAISIITTTGSFAANGNTFVPYTPMTLSPTSAAHVVTSAPNSGVGAAAFPSGGTLGSSAVTIPIRRKASNSHRSLAGSSPAVADSTPKGDGRYRLQGDILTNKGLQTIADNNAADDGSTSASTRTQTQTQTVTGAATQKVSTIIPLGSMPAPGSNNGDADGVEKTAMPAKKRRQLFTLPLAFIFTYQNTLIVFCFVFIIAYSSIQMKRTATDLVDDGVRSALKFASTELYGPLGAFEGTIATYRARYLATGALTLGGYPCDDRTAATLLINSTNTNSSNTNTSGGLSIRESSAYYSDMVLTMRESPAIVSAFVATEVTMNGMGAPPIDWSSVRSYAGIKDSISQCSVAPTSLYRRYRQLSLTTHGVPETDELRDVDAWLAKATINVSAATTASHEEDHIIAALTADRVRSFPTSRGAHGGIFLMYTMPVSFAVTNATNGAVTQHAEYGDSSMLAFAARPDVASVRLITGMGFVWDLTFFHEVLEKVTPGDGDGNAHTSLYDLTNGVLVATSALPRNEQTDAVRQTLYVSGAVPSVPSVNSAFFESLVSTSPVNTLRVDFDDNAFDCVVSSVSFVTPYANARYGIVQSTPRSFYYSETDHLRNVMIILGVVACIICLVTCLAVAISMGRGIRHILANMALAARMKNDRVSYVSTFVADIDRLAKGFGKMNDMLLEARAYLPQHMLLTTSSDDSDEEGDGGSGEADEDADSEAGGGARTNHTATSLRSDTHPMTNLGTATTVTATTTTRLETSNGNSTVVTGSTARRFSDRRARDGGKAAPNNRKGSKGNAAATQITRSAVPTALNAATLKRVTILAINGRGSHKICDIFSPAGVETMTTSLTETIRVLAHAHRGVIDSFHGDHFVISFNAARANAEGPTKAARCAFELAQMGVASGFKFSAMGISTGRACVGNLGTTALKRLSIIGPVYSKAIALEKMCRRFNPPVGTRLSHGDAPIQVIIDAAMAADIQHHFELQVLGGVFGAPYNAPPRLKLDSAVAGAPPSEKRSFGLETIYAVRFPTAVDAAGGDEWLYEISANRSGQLTEINAALLAYLASLRGPRIHNAFFAGGGKGKRGNDDSGVVGEDLGTFASSKKEIEGDDEAVYKYRSALAELRSRLSAMVVDAHAIDDRFNDYGVHVHRFARVALAHALAIAEGCDVAALYVVGNGGGGEGWAGASLSAAMVGSSKINGDAGAMVAAAFAKQEGGASLDIEVMPLVSSALIVTSTSDATAEMEEAVAVGRAAFLSSSAAGALRAADAGVGAVGALSVSSAQRHVALCGSLEPAFTASGCFYIGSE